MLPCLKEKNKKTQATSKPCAPSRFGCELIRTQSYRAAVFLQDDIARMCSRRIPLMLLRSLGARKVATSDEQGFGNPCGFAGKG